MKGRGDEENGTERDILKGKGEKEGAECNV